MFIALSDYPVQAVNWHDRTAWPGLAEASELVPHAVMGGVEQFTTLHLGSAEEVKAQVRDAVQQMRGHRLIVTTGCTYPLGVPHSNLLAMRQAVEALDNCAWGVESRSIGIIDKISPLPSGKRAGEWAIKSPIDPFVYSK